MPSKATRRCQTPSPSRSDEPKTALAPAAAAEGGTETDAARASESAEPPDERDAPPDNGPARGEPSSEAIEQAIIEAYGSEPPERIRLEGAVLRLSTVVDGRLEEYEGDDALDRLPDAVTGEGGATWIDLCGAKPELVGQIARSLGLHPLLAEDIAERDQRAKLEEVEETLHLVLFSLAWEAGRIYDREIDFVLGKRFLLSSHSRWWDPLASRHIRMGVQDLLRRGADYTLWALADDIVDAYFPILDRLGDEIDDLEDEVVSRADRATLERLFALKRDLIDVRRVTAPEREMFNNLSSRDDGVVQPAHSLYFRDTYDHLIRVTDELDTYRELVSATVDAYLSTVNNNLSLIMKRLTAVTLVLAGVGAVGGLFGMSEAGAAFRGEEGPGFWFVLLGTLGIAAAITWFLRRIDWI